MSRPSRESRPVCLTGPWIGFGVLLALSFLCLLLDAGSKHARALERDFTFTAEARERHIERQSGRLPRNVILMIGDGMGPAQLTLARYQKGDLAVHRMPVSGLSYTQSLRDFVTDSAAAATALAAGERVANGAVGQRPDGTRIRSVVEVAEELEMWTGLVATSRVTHATPAAMATHVPSRAQEHAIAEQLAASGVEVLLGGGRDMFRGRPDGRDLIQEMIRGGYSYVHTASELTLASTRVTGRLLGLFSPAAMPKVTEGRSPALKAMALAALRVLARSPRGFFLMVEGSQIDWGGHQNDVDYVLHETVDFDDALDAVLRFLSDAGIEDETLVVVTADHETGGLTLHANPKLRLGVEPRWTTEGHTGVPVPVFARGPAALRFSGVQDHARIGRELIRLVSGE